MKQCSKCKQEKHKDRFSCTKRNSDGSCRYYGSWCNECRTKDNRRRSGASEKIKPFIGKDEKECLKCFVVKGTDQFYPSTRGRLGRSSYCKECQPRSSKEHARVNTAAYRKRHKERWRSAHRIHQFNRRSKIAATCDSTVDDHFLKEIYTREKCYWCGKFVESDRRTLEHIIELSQGGRHSASNITMACDTCNFSRRNKDGKHRR